MLYSEKEKELFRMLDLEEFIDGWISPTAPVFYDMAMKNAFMKNIQGPIADSIRRCLKAINDPNPPYRLTPEWDALIDLTLPVE